MPDMVTRQQDSIPTGPDNGLDTAIDSHQASLILGISEDGVRKRVIRGTLRGYKDCGRWYVYLPDGVGTNSTTPTDSPDSVQTPMVDGKDLAIAAMEARAASLEKQLEATGERISSLEGQLQTKDTQIDQLHHLLAQTALSAAPARPWWKIW